MNKRLKTAIAALSAAALLSGCAMPTVEQLYCLPKRSLANSSLQSVIDRAMQGHSYSAPLYGDNRQTVREVDLDGDGLDEYLVLAKDESEQPLKIMIFCQLASGFVLMDTIKGYGTAYDFVEFADMDDRPGMEIIIGRLVSNEMVRSATVYGFSSGSARYMGDTSYTKIMPYDINGDSISELVLIHPGESMELDSMAVVYHLGDNGMYRGSQTRLSLPCSQIKKMEVVRLKDNKAAFMVTAESGKGIQVELFAHKDGEIRKVSAPIEINPAQHALVYPTDMDGDKTVEIPELIPVRQNGENGEDLYWLGWYSLSSEGQRTDNQFGYFNFRDNWYLTVKRYWAYRFTLVQGQGICSFYSIKPALPDSLTHLQPEIEIHPNPVLTIYTVTASNAHGVSMDGKILLHSGDGVSYMAELGENAAEFGLNEKLLKAAFRPI